MKKTISFLLVIIMVMSFTACGSKEAPNADNYDPKSLDSMLIFLSTASEKASADTATEAEDLLKMLGETYNTYDANKTEVTAYFENMQTRSSDLYTAFQTCSIDYFKCIATQGLDDYNSWDDAMGDFYDEWDDAMSGYYDSWDDAYDDIYSTCDKLVSNAADKLDYKDYSDIWSAMYEEYSDAWSDMYDAYSDAWQKTYSDYSDVWRGFYHDNSDVDTILAESKENSKDDEEKNTSDHDSDATATSYDDLEDKIQTEVESALNSLTDEWETLIAGVDSYEIYTEKESEIEAFYDKVNNTSAMLCVQMCQYSIAYAEAILASGKSTDDMYSDLEEIYDLIYDDMGDEIYDSIYDGILDEMYNNLYSGALEDRPDGIEYSDWSDVRSREYKIWSHTRSATYEHWSDFRSDVYGFWSDIRGAVYGDDLDDAQDEIESFREASEKQSGNLSPTEDTSSETSHNASVTPDVRPEFKEAMDSYEEFFDDYVIFMKAYKESEDTISMSAEYTSMMTQYFKTMTELQKVDEDDLSDEEALYYAEVMLRINQKLLQVT